MATLPQWLQDVITRRDAVAAELAAIDNNGSRTKPGAKPDVSGDGGGVQGTAYRQSLQAELDQHNETIKSAKAVIDAEAALQSNDPVVFDIPVVYES